ncbi:uncharacterized protein LOC117282782 [Cryptotermes secundus]|uniref:uncharacterized protein LOC117282782 n=1 Tax=Cryptotermes secundus TaxID=105785 RepID=UPI001454E020|nr:uncharacterized protein LOC117282782 [Cryptotermes secundus]
MMLRMFCHCCLYWMVEPLIWLKFLCAFFSNSTELRNVDGSTLASEHVDPNSNTLKVLDWPENAVSLRYICQDTGIVLPPVHSMALGPVCKFNLTIFVASKYCLRFRYICQDTGIVLPPVHSMALGPVCKFNLTIFVASKYCLRFSHTQTSYQVYHLVGTGGSSRDVNQLES